MDLRRYLFTVAIVCGACAGPAADQSPLAVAAGDQTAIVEACGKGPIVGYSYCRFHEGAPAEGEVVVHVPRGSRSQVAFLGPDGESKLMLESADGSPVRVPWSTLLASPSFSRSTRGFWIVLVRTQLPDGTFVIAEGEIRVRVLALDAYEPLDRSWAPSLCAWRWRLSPAAEACVTVAGRASLRFGVR